MHTVTPVACDYWPTLLVSHGPTQNHFPPPPPRHFTGRQVRAYSGRPRAWGRPQTPTAKQCAWAGQGARAVPVSGHEGRRRPGGDRYRVLAPWNSTPMVKWWRGPPLAPPAGRGPRKSESKARTPGPKYRRLEAVGGGSVRSERRGACPPPHTHTTTTTTAAAAAAAAATATGTGTATRTRATRMMMIMLVMLMMIMYGDDDV